MSSSIGTTPMQLVTLAGFSNAPSLIEENLNASCGTSSSSEGQIQAWFSAANEAAAVALARGEQPTATGAKVDAIGFQTLSSARCREIPPQTAARVQKRKETRLAREAAREKFQRNLERFNGFPDLVINAKAHSLSRRLERNANIESLMR